MFWFKTVAASLVLSVLMISPAVEAASRQEIDAKVKAALDTFYETTAAGRELAGKSVAMLVFPDVVKAGFGIGGEYGEGALLRNGRTSGYYSIASASIGFQFGAQVKSEIILFMTSSALNGFLSSDGWEAGVDGSVALATLGAGGEIDTQTAQQPIIGFIFSNKGLMYNLSLEGAKISEIAR
ncbi:BPSL1445 family SYLF domain-containing lipoprotein [Marinobacterium jannaschii]|uniref:BPSL1445 family SYLF domain-containing lipoprotein n=1 Tax=Marinobacterium jannaschii TaxID=64970 RepID=UPI00055C9AFC|nr:YSC84-related protein [Marinobacterium jannaschii]